MRKTIATQLEILSDDEDEIWLFECTAKELRRKYGHSEAKAFELVDGYYKKFTSPAFCLLHDIPEQTSEFFFREDSLTMADRIQFYEFMGNLPDEESFIQWERKMRG